jgi:diguanylate cyclase (GGDEF)-like protein
MHLTPMTGHMADGTESRPATPWLVPTALALAVALGVLLRFAPYGGTLWVLAVLPAGLATWFGGARWGMVAVLSGIAASLVPTAALTAQTDPVPTLEWVLRVGLLFSSVGAVASMRRGSSRTEARSGYDPSTGLANSRTLFDQVTNEVDRARRYGRPFTLSYIAIENLPALRQRYGEAAVEEALRRVAHQVRGALRSVDTVARLREREFAVVFPETGPEAARIVLDRLERMLDASVVAEMAPLGFAIGAVTWIRSELTVQELHQRTYQLMYSVRRDDQRLTHETLDGANLRSALETLPESDPEPEDVAQESPAK